MTRLLPELVLPELVSKIRQSAERHVSMPTVLLLQMRRFWRRMWVRMRQGTAAAAATGAARPWSSAPWWPSSSGARRSRASPSPAASRCAFNSIPGAVHCEPDTYGSGAVPR